MTTALVFMVLMGLGVALEDPEAKLKHCEWQCQESAPDETSPDYLQCVENRCGEFATKVTPPRVWRVRQIPSDASATLERREAWTTDPHGNFRLTYQCSRDGHSYLILSGDMLEHSGLLHGQPVEVRFTIDETRERALAFSNHEGALVRNISANDPLLGFLRRGSEALVETPNFAVTFGLNGSESAIGDTLDYCAKG